MKLDRLQNAARYLDELWDFYEPCFDEVNKHAVQRHKMHRSEFVNALADRALTKYVVRDSNDEVTGLGLMTNHLPAWPLISPEYFQHHYPMLFADNRIFYVGFVGATGRGAFRTLIKEMIVDINAVDGVAIMDYCQYNEDKGVPRVSEWAITSANPAGYTSLIDTQRFYLTTFDGLRSDLP